MNISYKFYRLYDLILGSQIDLDYPTIDACKLDVEIKLVNSLKAITTQTFNSQSFHGNQDSIQFSTWDNVECQINKGSEILIKDNANSKRLSQIIFSHVLPLLLIQRGNITFHASSNLVDSEAILFIGNNGSGKSTTCVALQQNGFPVLADDCITCTVSNSEVFALPTLANVRLCHGKDSFVDKTKLPIAYIDDKVTFHRSWNSTEKIKISKIFALEWSKDEKIERLSEKDSLYVLLKNIWFPWATQVILKDKHLQLCANIAKAIPIYLYKRSLATDPSIDAGNFIFNLKN